MIKRSLLFSAILSTLFTSFSDGFAETCLESESSIVPGSNFLPVTFVNGTKIVTDDNVYILVKGIDPLTNRDCYINFDPSSGVGSCVDVTTSTSSFSYSFKLSQLPSGGGGRLVYFPAVNSGRIYCSMGAQLNLHVDGVTQKIADPDPFNTSDPNYSTFYDKVEFTYQVPGGIFMNLTAVDFFCLPISLHLTSNGAAQSSGFTQSRSSIFSSVRSIFAQNDRTAGKIWNNLIVPYRDPTTNTVTGDLRVVATGKGMSMSPPIFDPNYLSNNSYGFNWIANVWSSYYQSHSLSVDCTELAAPNNQIFTGHVNGANQFVFTAASGSPTVAINLPSNSEPFFAAAGGSFDAQNNTPQAIIIRDLTAATVTGLLPAPSGTILGRNYFASNMSRYYTANSLLPAAGQTTGPWYDLYSKALHSFGVPIYTFAYDDILGIDGTVAASNTANPAVTITLADLTGTPIPHTTPTPPTPPTPPPSGKYNVTVRTASNNPVTYNGQVLMYGQTISNVAQPFSVQLLGSDHVQHTANIYFSPPSVTPAYSGSTGILIQVQNTNVILTFPGI